MKYKAKELQINVTETEHHCPSGETVGKHNMTRSTIPVLSCEGACIRGEIARQAANMVAKEKAFGRGCHGELLTVPGSSIAQWILNANQVILIDGCFLRCHGRIVENILDEDKLTQFDALAIYKKYTALFAPEDVPEKERLATARVVANTVLNRLKVHEDECKGPTTPQGCCGK